MRSVALGYDTRYAYGADGNRAAKWTAGNLSETLYFNTMWTWHIEKGLSQEQQGQYSKHIYLGETRIVTKQTSDLEEHYGPSEELRHQYYYHPDHLGSAQLVTDYEGNEYQRIEYTPYGELWVEKKTANEKDMRYLPYKFTAKEQDEETGLYYYGARYLDAKYSRWLSADPAVSDYIPQAPISDEARKHNQNLPGMGGVFNVVNLQLYHYAGNNPVKYTDPDGRELDSEIVAQGFKYIYDLATASEDKRQSVANDLSAFLNENPEFFGVAGAAAALGALGYGLYKSNDAIKDLVNGGKRFIGQVDQFLLDKGINLADLTYTIKLTNFSTTFDFSDTSASLPNVNINERTILSFNLSNNSQLFCTAGFSFTFSFTDSTQLNFNPFAFSLVYRYQY